MLFMPLIFVLFVIRFPAGVLVYWITTNLWTVAQQYVVKRRIGPIQAATPGGGTVVDSTATSTRPRPSPTRETGSDKAKASDATPNGSGGGGLSSLIRRARPPEPSGNTGNGAGNGAKPGAVPPRSPRKKKKRSGRRR
jgi:YidC/Oxa1 family membrane protein insertase